MKIAIVGSRNITEICLDDYVSECDEIVSGGARGVDSLAAEYATKKGIKLTEFMPEYEKYGKAAPIKRNEKIVDYADKIIVFWDGSSKGSFSVIKYAKKIGKPCETVICD
jgi:predicted Rossmann fold nucleotide-binding protein DprA/Smf involved in DNA uptake